MADRIRYLLPDKGVLDSATAVVSLVAATESDGLPPRNVQDEHIRKVYRTTAKTSQYLRYRFAAATTMTALFVGKHNFTRNATVYWQGNTTSSFASPALTYTIGVATDSRGNVIPKLMQYWSAAPTAYAHWRLWFSDAGNATANLEIGRILGGRYDEPARDIRDGFSVQLVDPSRVQQTAGRQGYANVKTKFARITYAVGAAEGALDNTMQGIYNEVGVSTPFVLSLNPDSRPHHESYYVCFTDPLTRRHRINSAYDWESLTAEEKI